MTRLPQSIPGLKVLSKHGSGLGAAPRPGSYANTGEVPAASSHPEGGHSGEPAPPLPQARIRKDQTPKELRCSSAVFPGLRRTLASCGGGPDGLQRAPEHRELGPEQLPAVPRNHRARAQGAARGWGTFRGRKWPRECRREGEAGAREPSGEQTG